VPGPNASPQSFLSDAIIGGGDHSFLLPCSLYLSFYDTLFPGIRFKALIGFSLTVPIFQISFFCVSIPLSISSDSHHFSWTLATIFGETFPTRILLSPFHSPHTYTVKEKKKNPKNAKYGMSPIQSFCNAWAQTQSLAHAKQR
jgi:hypothetical protein